MTRRFIYTYKAFEEERLQIGFLSKAPPAEVVAWLRENWSEPEGSNFSDFDADDKRRLAEYLLTRRNDPLIDWGIARYGQRTGSIQAAYDRGDTSTKIAALGNSRGGIKLKQRDEVLREKKWTYVKALLVSPYLPSQFLTNLLKREEAFSDLGDERFRIILQALAGNRRLITRYDETYLDGYSDYIYNSVFSAAWELVRSVPATLPWAATLESLLSKCHKPHGFAEIDQALERWRIDPPDKSDPPRWYNRGAAFGLRSLIADHLPADESLSNSEDPALRISFYRRFEPWKFTDWPSFLKRDGEEFVDAALRNELLWSDPDRRSTLSQLCWASPDPTSSMDMPNRFRALAKLHIKDHPTWFTDEERKADEEHASGDLESVNAKLDKLLSLQPDGSLTQPPKDRRMWWIWLLVGGVASHLFLH